MKKFFIILFFLSFTIGHLSYVRAAYILPYPSFMPGNTLYKVAAILDFMKRYWSFGNISQLKYRMNMADKKLVEAKTLFEYKQYALAMNALNDSTTQVILIPQYIDKAVVRDIDMKQFLSAVCEQMKMHKEVLQQFRTSLPSAFIWREEKKDAVNLQIQEAIESALKIRVTVLTQRKCL